MPKKIVGGRSFTGGAASPRQPTTPTRAAAEHLRLTASRYLRDVATISDVEDAARLFSNEAGSDARPMHVFTCTSFEGHWPVGTSAVVVANDKKHAATLLRDWLRANGLSPSGFTLTEVDLCAPQAIILQSGEY